MLFDGLKSSLLWDEQTDAWTYASGGPTTPMQDRYKMIPTLFRGVNIIANSVADMPFKIYGKNGKTEVDSSQEYKNKVGFLPKPHYLFSLVSMSLDLCGKAYLRQLKNAANFPQLFYQIPTSITEQISQGQLTGWKRHENGQDVPLAVKDVIYLWLADPYVELGPPTAFPAQAALAASNVLGNMDAYIALYFERGAIRPVIVSVKGAPSAAERERMETWFQKLMGGIRRGFQWKVLNADTVDIKQIGDGLDSLQDTELTASKRQDVAHALGIPYAILFSEAANNATAQTDQLALFQQTIVPRCEFIASELNTQMFIPAGYKLEFQPETLDIYQEDENQRSQALTAYVNAGFELLMACDILGIELTEDQRAQLEAEKVEKEKRREEMAQLAAMAPKAKDEETPEEQPNTTTTQPPQFQQQTEEQKAIDADLGKWKRKANKALAKGESACVPFESVVIPLRLGEKITAALKSADTPEAIDNAFIIGDMIPDLAVELQKTNILWERTLARK
jgi:phage portal protein BeeE